MRQNEPIQYNPLYTRCENRCGLFFIVATHYSAASFTEPAFPSLFIPIIQPCRLVDRHILRHGLFTSLFPKGSPFHTVLLMLDFASNRNNDIVWDRPREIMGIICLVAYRSWAIMTIIGLLGK